jgi:hypothetical protein
MEAEKYADLLKKEIEILEKIASIQALLKNAAVNREWTDFYSLLEQVQSQGREFEILEARRAGLFEGSGSAGFYALVSRLPENNRKELSELYRKLKLETLKTRMANDTLLRYLNEGRAVIALFLEEVFPDRKGKFYSRLGKHIQTDMRSMVLNRSC